MIVYCEDCGEIVDQIRAMKGKHICAKCQKRIYNKTYYDKNREELIKRSVETKKALKEERDKEKARKAKNAEHCRAYRERKKAGLVGTQIEGRANIPADMLKQMIKDLYGRE